MKIRQIIAVALLFAAGGAQGQLPQDIEQIEALKKKCGG